MNILNARFTFFDDGILFILINFDLRLHLLV